jgi:hypothetical protein
VIDSQIIFTIIALNACVLAAVFFGTFIFSETVRSSRSGLAPPEPPPPPRHFLPPQPTRRSWNSGDERERLVA